MLRNTFAGASTSGAPGSGCVRRWLLGCMSGVQARFMACALLLMAAPLAQAEGWNTLGAAAFAEPCSSAKAVHDMRCPNYTGFKNRLGGDTPEPQAPEAAETRSGEPSLSLPRQPALGLRAGRDLQRGVASWYGPGFHGRTTANGEKFNMHELTAAHKTLPFGTRVLVHNPRTGKEVVVRINDRGPFVKGRVIDLSKAAAKALGFKSRGHDTVVLREVLPTPRGS